MTLLLGIDLGTSNIKAVLFDPDTRQIVAVAGEEYPLHKPKSDRAEQNPDDWWEVTARVVRWALAQADRDDVSAIGFSGQMHGTALIGHDGRPVRPAIIWADQRSAEQCHQLVEPIGAEAYTRIAGTLPAAGFMGPTLLWLRQNEPDSLRQARAALFPKDYVRFKMTGEISTDFSDAASSGIFNVQGYSWAANIVAAAEIPEALLPKAYLASKVVGQLQSDAAAKLGLRAGIPVTAGCGDQPAQAVANGLIAPGIASLSIGSGGQVFIPIRPPNSELKTDPRCHVFNHAIPDTFFVLSAILSAGLSLRWLRDLLHMSDDDLSFTILNQEASRIAPGADGLIFQPYLYGERTPHMDAYARGSFIGLSYYHTRGHLARAVMEGIAFAMRQAFEVGLSVSEPINAVIGAGGGMQVLFMRQLVADVVGQPIRMTTMTEHAGVGAAWLAGIGAGVYRDAEDACSHNLAYEASIEPDANRHAFYNERYEQYKTLYPLLREEFHRLSRDPSRA